MSQARRTLTATFLAFVLVAVGVFAIWLVAGSGVFATTAPQLGGPLPAAANAAAPGGDAGLPLAPSIQVAQPRDPFAPLTSEPPVTSSTLPGQTTTTEPGATTTTEGFDPEETRVVLLEIREEGGVDKAVLTVDGVTYVVAVGETFADNFKVVSLSDDSGVFLYGDSAFTLAVGQAILK